MAEQIQRAGTLLQTEILLARGTLTLACVVARRPTNPVRRMVRIRQRPLSIIRPHLCAILKIWKYSDYAKMLSKETDCATFV